MKTAIIGFFFFLILSNGYSQDLNYSVHGKYENPITKEKLHTARTMGDIIPYYPSSWIEKYNSAEISVKSNNDTRSAKSSNDILSEDQIKMLGSLDFGAEININIGYQYLNSVTKQTENRNMQYSATIVPDKEAEYSNGYEQLTLYIKQNAIDKIAADDTKELQLAVVRFTVNEAGKITGSRIEKTSGNESVDKLLLDVISEMPDWQPAADSQGNKVRQEFELIVSNGSDGC